MSDLLELVQALQMAMKAQLMYTGAHPRAKSALDNLTVLIEEWLEGSPTLHIAASGGKVFLDGTPFEGQSLHLTATARMLADRQISGVVFSRGITPEEVHEVLELFILKPARIEERGGAARILEDKHLTHVQLSQTQYREVREGEGGEEASGGPAMRPRTLGPTEAAAPATAAPAPESGKRPDITPTLDALQALVDQWRHEFRRLPAKVVAQDGPGTGGSGSIWDGGPGSGGPGAGGPGLGGPGTGGPGSHGTGAGGPGSGGPGTGGPGSHGIGAGGPGSGGPGSGGPGSHGIGAGGPGSGGPGSGGPGSHGIGASGPGSGAPGDGGPGSQGIGAGGPGSGASGDGGPGSQGIGAGGPGSGASGDGGPGSQGIGAGGPGSGASGEGGPGSQGIGAGGPGRGAAGEGGPGSQGIGGVGAGWAGAGFIDLSFLGTAMVSAGLSEGFPTAEQMEALRRSLRELPPQLLLSVVAGLDTLPQAPAGLRMGFHALAPEMFANAAADLLGEGAPWGPLKDRLHGILQNAPSFQSLLAALEGELRRRGMGLENLNELVARLDWDTMGLDEQLRLVMEHDHLWKLSQDQRLEFLRKLLEEGRLDAFTSLLEQIIRATVAEDPGFRELAARTLGGVARWLAVPGLPSDIEAILIQGLAAHFGWEPMPQPHRATSEALATAVANIIERGEPGRAVAVLEELDGLCAFLESRETWRTEAIAWLWGRLGQPGALDRVLELLHTANPETLLTEFIPYLEKVGPAAAQRLVEVLGQEQDRKRRIRLVEVIRSLGDLAIPAVHDSLASDKWYLVRNTLNLLADLGDTGALHSAEGCLAHADGRVRRAAVRTVWKLGGPNSIPALLAAFQVADAETALEIMFAFSQIRSAATVPALGQFAADRRITEKLRARAAETLGQIGNPQAIPFLEDLIRRKGRFFSTAEPTEIRLAACRALATLGTANSLATLRGLVAAEPRNHDRPLMQQVAEQAP